MFNGYVLYLQAVTTPNPFVKLPKLPFHKSLLLIFCLRLRFPFSFFKLFFAAAALVISPGWLRLFSRGGLFFRRLWLFSQGGSGYFPTVALVIFPGWPVFRRLGLFSRGGSGYFPRRLGLFSRGGSGYFSAAAWLFSHGGFGYFPGVACFSCGSGYFPRWLWLFFRGGLFFSAALVIFPPR